MKSINIKSRDGSRRFRATALPSGRVRLYRISNWGGGEYLHRSVMPSTLRAILGRKLQSFGSWLVTYPDRSTFQIGCQKFSMNVARRLLKLSTEARNK